ncbi:unnamed protein product, partial [Cochlearia groenlandica]
METPPVIWSKLPVDILRSVFESLSFVDFQRSKMVCSNWYSVSKQTVPRKIGSPWLMLFPEDVISGHALYNPREDKIYMSLRDFSELRFLANSGKWFLVVDARSNLYIVDVFSETRIDLPPIDSLLSDIITLKRVGDKEFRTSGYASTGKARTDDLRGLLWVDEKTEEYVVVWFFYSRPGGLGFCRKGDDHYSYIPLRLGVQKLLNGACDLVLRGYRLYILSTRRYVRVLDLSGQQGFQDITVSNPPPMFSPGGYCCDISLAVTSSGEVLLVESLTIESQRSFTIYKQDPNADPFFQRPILLEVDSLGDEALLLDLGITVPASPTHGIEPNSIYFTRHDDHICVFNLATKTLKRFPSLSNM